MLSIASMSAGVEYYLNLAREDYYLKGGEPAGIWWGEGAAHLGLSGKINSHDLHSLYRGFAPDGTELVQNAGSKTRQSGWDLTFSAPKSVSTLWSQGDAELRHQIQAAHFEAVKAALTYIQEEAALTRRGKAGSESERARLIVGTFEHGTSRDLDPNLHTHALVMNACSREDGTWGTIRSKPIFLNKMAAGALYRAELAAQLETHLSLRCELDERGFAFSIEGTNKKLDKIFSKRREAVEEKLKSHGVESAAAAAAATIITRKSKGEVPSREELFAKWKDVGDIIGFDPKEMLGRKPRGPDRPEEFKKAFETALEKITTSESHFTKKELLQEIAIQAQSRCLSAQFIRDQLNHALENSKEIHELGVWNGAERFTTPAVLAAEKDLIKSADRLRANFNGHGASHAIIADAIGQSKKPLNDEQKEAVWHLTKKASGLRSLEGLAGTGKTSTLSITRQALEKAGYRVIGAATSGKAAQELYEGAGVKSVSIAKLDFMMKPPVDVKLEHHARQILRALLKKPTYKLAPVKFDKKTVLILDEAAMVSTKELAKLVAAVEKGGGMLISVFDRKQLQAIGPGGGAAFLADRHGKAELNTIVRQKDARDVSVVKAFAEGKAEEALKIMAQRGLVHVADDRAAAMKRLVSDWAWEERGKRDRSLIFVGTRAEVAEVNERCQEARLHERELRGEKYSKGDLTLYHGDRVLFTKKTNQVQVENGTLGTIVKLTPAEKIAAVKLDSGEIVQVPLKSYKSLQLGYAVTTHKAQGTTVDNSYILAGGSMQDRELTYVQASRARLAMHLYTDKLEAGDNFSRLAKQMNKSNEKILAHEIIAQQEKERQTLRLKRELGI